MRLQWTMNILYCSIWLTFHCLWKMLEFWYVNVAEIQSVNVYRGAITWHIEDDCHDLLGILWRTGIQTNHIRCLWQNKNTLYYRIFLIFGCIRRMLELLCWEYHLVFKVWVFHLTTVWLHTSDASLFTIIQKVGP